MSPTSYQTAPPRDHLICYLFIKKLGGKLTNIKAIAKPRLHRSTIALKMQKITLYNYSIKYFPMVCKSALYILNRPPASHWHGWVLNRYPAGIQSSLAIFIVSLSTLLLICGSQSASTSFMYPFGNCR